MQYLDAISKTTEWSLFISKANHSVSPFNIIQVYALTKQWRNWSWTVLWRPTRPFRSNTPKICPFHYWGLECKSRKSRNTWSNRQFGLGMRNEAGQRLIEFCQENAQVIANTLFQQHKRRLHTWTSPDGQHWNQIDYILCRKQMDAIKLAWNITTHLNSTGEGVIRLFTT